MIKRFLVLIIGLFLLTACGQAVEGGLIIRTADENIAFFVPVAPGPEPCMDIKGNIGADGRKLYHVRGESPNFEQVVISKPGEQYFCSTSDAEAAGFVRAGN